MLQLAELHMFTDGRTADEWTGKGQIISDCGLEIGQGDVWMIYLTAIVPL